MKIEVEGLSYSYAGGNPALDGISLVVEPGELLALLGPSGSGKTTFLMLVAGFYTPSRGRIALDGLTASAPETRVPPRSRDIGMVFQDLALWPHLSVAGHLDFALRTRSVPRAERRRRKTEVLELVELRGFEGRLPETLSGGEEQRLALARALVTRPKILLLDEPLGALDRRLRDQMLGLIARAHEELKATTVYVTHDFEEALSTAERVAILERGRLLQRGRPEDVYRFPSSDTVAQLGGPVTLLEGRPVGGGRVRLPLGDSFAVLAPTRARTLTVALRPEQVEVRSHIKGEGTVTSVRFSRGGWEVEVETAGVLIRGRSARSLLPGQRVTVRLREPLWGFEKNLPQGSA